ncbi:SPOR domain-containing protein [Novosphingobium sp.]|uniref:SPOR domain-containing protein n=1 Tax=Novosphingobium sp. TaxID=1874826 RepID=UPI003BAC3E7F
MIRRLLRSGLPHRLSIARFGLVAATALAVAQPAIAAQRTGPVDDDAVEPVTTTSIPVVQSTVPSPTRLLNAALARLARDPRDVSALLDAGGAALDLGDNDAAIGFLTRAEQVAPGTAGVRARMGIAMLRSNQPFEAIHWFDLAEQAGFNRVEIATDRGLAYDLIGDNAAAQRQYQLALTAGQNDEASRRYALSLVIAGDRRGAEQVIQPLLERSDRGAWRVRAFIMAIAGQSDEAEGIAKATMPADLATAISPYLRYMPRLTPAQQAAAANLGRFPRAADIGRDDPQIVQYALAHPRAPRVDAALVPQGEALGARGRDDRSKRRRPGKEDRRETAVAAAAPAPAPAAPAVSAPWGLPPGTRTAAAAPQPAPPTPQFQTLLEQAPAPTPPPAAAQARPTVLSKLDVPPGTPLSPPPAPQPRVVTPGPVPVPTPPQPIAPPPVPKPAVTTPAPAPVQVATATPTAPVPVSAPTTAGPQLALVSPPPSSVPAAQTPVTPTPIPSAPVPPPAPAPTPAPAATPPAPTPPPAPADFRSAFDGFKPPAQETAATTEAVDLARIEALRESAAKAAAAKAKDRSAKDRSAKDRGERPDGPTAVSRTSDQEAAEPAVTRSGREKAAEKDIKGKKDKLALDTDCLDASAKGKAGKGKGKAAPARGKAAAKSGTKSAKGKAAAEAQCPPENGKAAKAKAKAELAHASRIWVQVLTGSNRAAMSKEWDRLVREAAALRGRKPSITPWRSNYRLLTGPFASDAEAQAFVEKLRGEGVSSYQWTSPAGQAVDSLSVK